MAKGTALTEELWVKLVAFYQEGHSYRECATFFGIGTSTVGLYFRRHPEIPRRKPFEPSRPEKARTKADIKSVPPEEIPPPGGPPTVKRRIVPLKEF